MTTAPQAKTRIRRGPALAASAALGLLAACSQDRHLIGEGMTKSDPLQVDGGAGLSSATPDAAGPLAARQLAISGREAVRRLGLVLWNQPSDPALLAEADSGAFKTSEDIRKLALRMLDDPRARGPVGAFYRWWLKQDDLLQAVKDPTLFPEFTPALRAEMANETETFGVHVTLDLHAGVRELLTAPYGFSTERLAPLYGLTGVTGPEHRKTPLGDDRSGVLTLAGVLATTSLPHRVSPTVRGKFVLEHLLCTPPPPPPSQTPPLADAAPEGTTRERLTSLLQGSPACQGCHSLIDPPGFALDGFDVIGRARTVENGRPLNTQARLSGTLTGFIAGARDLGLELAAVRDTTNCFAQHYLTFALGGTPLRQPAIQSLQKLFADVVLRPPLLREHIASVMQSEAILGPDFAR
ncbi:MAG TPA: DUF1592 domain-containing protein [Polyangia bacterium]